MAKDRFIKVRVTQGDKDRYKSSAEILGTDVSSIMLGACERAVKRAEKLVREASNDIN